MPKNAGFKALFVALMPKVLPAALAFHAAKRKTVTSVMPLVAENVTFSAAPPVPVFTGFVLAKAAAYASRLQYHPAFVGPELLRTRLLKLEKLRE